MGNWWAWTDKPLFLLQVDDGVRVWILNMSQHVSRAVNLDFFSLQTIVYIEFFPEIQNLIKASSKDIFALIVLGVESYKFQFFLD